MDSSLYKTITSVDSTTDGVSDEDLLLQMTPLKNTTLHVAVQYRNTSCVKEISNRCPSLLMQQNSKGDTPLHIAAKLGSSDIVEVLICCAQTHNEDVEKGKGGVGGLVDEGLSTMQQLVRMMNRENETALHLAVGSHNLDIVNLLTETDPTFEYFANGAGETPLYLAVEKGLYEIVARILEKCPTSAHSGPRGKTAMHTAAVARSKSDMGLLILEKNPSINIKETDENGSTALHYAAYYGNVRFAIKLLEADPSIGYMLNKDGKTALHVAAAQSCYANIEIIEEVTRLCPDCWELIDNNGQNFFHVAAEKGRLRVINYVLEKSKMVENLINEEDNNGNTPLHLIVKSGRSYNSLEKLSKDNRVNKAAINKDNLTALDMVYENMKNGKEKLSDSYEKFLLKARDCLAAVSYRKLLEEEEERTAAIIHFKKRSDKIKSDQKSTDADGRYIEGMHETHLVVATLISTVSFAAGFTLPGGFNSKGMALLIKSPAFMAFLVFNSIAMLLSTFAVFIHFWSKLVLKGHIETLTRLMYITLGCTFFAIIAMVLAFVTGTYAVLSDSLGLAIPLCVLGGGSFLFFSVFILFKIYIWELQSFFRHNLRIEVHIE